jgi:hypothetical protein
LTRLLEITGTIVGLKEDDEADEETLVVKIRFKNDLTYLLDIDKITAAAERLTVGDHIKLSLDLLKEQ